MADNDLNEVVEEVVNDATVMTVPIDDTLTVSGEAADAKAVGDALALKADLSAVVSIDVNGQAADNQGHIIIDGTDVKMSGTDTRTLKAAIESAASQTAEDIPMSSDPGAQTVAEAISGIGDRNATEIPMSEDEEAVSIATKIAQTDATVSGIQQTIAGMIAKTGADIPLEPGSTKMIKGAIAERVLTVNSNTADANGDVRVDEVQFASNLKSEQSQTSVGEYSIRTSGGAASIESGDAWLVSVEGNNVHTGYVAEELEMTVIPVERQNPITATLDHDTFVAYVESSTTITLSYTADWSADPALYGVTVTGTPVNGDVISIAYTKEERGTIMVCNPESFVSTGYNIYDYARGYARVVKYSESYGYAIAGSYTSLAWAETPGGTQTAITVSGGQFQVPGDGYVIVTGGNGTNTRIWPTWSDWTSAGDAGSWEAYTESEVDLSDVMEDYFPNGLLSAGAVRDIIDINVGYCESKVERLAYSAANRAAAEASGRAYEFDENYIYLERSVTVVHSIELDGSFTASDHGIEFLTGDNPGTPVVTTLYGNNLRNKLERDVLTISEQELSASQKTQVQTNLGISLAGGLTDLFLFKEYSTKNSVTINANNAKSLNMTDFSDMEAPTGYTAIGLAGYHTGDTHLGVNMVKGTTTSGICMYVMNPTSSAITKNAGSIKISILYAKSEFVKAST